MIIQLSKKDWWEELGKRELPDELTHLVRDLVGEVLGKKFSPIQFIPTFDKPSRLTATPKLVTLAKKHLQEGLRIAREPYAVMVYQPKSVLCGSSERKNQHETSISSYFLLVPRWPGGTVKRLEEM